MGLPQMEQAPCVRIQQRQELNELEGGNHCGTASMEYMKLAYNHSCISIFSTLKGDVCLHVMRMDRWGGDGDIFRVVL